MNPHSRFLSSNIIWYHLKTLYIYKGHMIQMEHHLKLKDGGLKGPKRNQFKNVFFNEKQMPVKKITIKKSSL